jgi:hypothetical protein
MGTKNKEANEHAHPHLVRFYLKTTFGCNNIRRFVCFKRGLGTYSIRDYSVTAALISRWDRAAAAKEGESKTEDRLWDKVRAQTIEQPGDVYSLSSGQQLPRLFGKRCTVRRNVGRL